VIRDGWLVPGFDFRLPTSAFRLRGLPLVLLVSAIGACSNEGRGVYQGYAEGEYVRVAAPFAGTLQKLAVARGMQVKTGDPLFVLEQDNEAAARREAGERLKTAESQLADLQKAKRPTEINAVRAQLAQAEAAQRLSAASLKRTEDLVAKNFVSKQQLDESRETHARDVQRVEEMRAQLQTAQLAARPDEIKAAESNVGAARAALAQADWKLGQKSVAASVTGMVQDTFYVAGEWVNANQPVVSLLPPQNIKVRFFVEEGRVGAVKPGQKLSVTCDGCPAPISAAVTFISPQAEFTPPVIYSRQERAKLVFLIEARPAPEDAVRLHPGQPVDVKFVQ
jgi:HlyD family secretion protein